MLYTIRNEDLMAQVSSSGAQLMSLEGKNHTQYLWQGNPRYWSDRSLTIFPYVARLTKGCYRYKGKFYHMPIHGFGPSSDFSVFEQTESCVAFRLESNPKLYNMYPHELSGGMQQRIMICVALIANPRILIADEPTTALDATIQMQILSLFKEIEQIYHGGILFITHDLTLVSRICKRVLVMYAGRIVESGPVDVVINDPKHPYTKGLLKAIPSYKKRSEKLYNIPGQVPALRERKNECCPFFDRCENTMEICKEKFPQATEDSERIVYCHLYGGSND